MYMKTEFPIPRQSILYLLLCLTGVLIFLFLGIIPGYGSLRSLDRELDGLGHQMKEHETLLPVYESLQKVLHNTDKRILPMPEKEKIQRREIEKALKTFSQIASSSGMEIVSLFPDMNSMAGGAGLLQVNGAFRGDFFNFRRLLEGLGSLPYVEQMEEIDIRETDSGRDYRIKFWLAIN